MFKRLFSRSGLASGDEVALGHAYAYKASLIGAAHRYELTQDGLSWRTGRRSGVWRYQDVAAVRLSYRPMGMQHRRFRADLRHVDGRRITIFSTSKQTVALMQPQSGYGAFILQLHRRLVAAGGEASLQAGLSQTTYALIIAALSCIGLAMAAMLVRAIYIGEWAGVVFVLGFAGFFGWHVSGFIRINKPRSYTFDNVPQDLLP